MPISYTVADDRVARPLPSFAEITTTEPHGPDFEQIPADLKVLPQWVCWRIEERAGDPTKVPYNAESGRRARSNDPTTWTTFDTAVNAYLRGGYAGVGFMFWERDRLTGLDLDHVIDLETGEIDSRALEILERFKGTYCEISPSGTGFRIFTRGSPGRSGKNEGRGKWLEVYTHPSHRYLTVTGHHWSQSAVEITAQQDALDWLHEKYFTKPAKPKPTTKPATMPNLGIDDSDLLDKARTAANGHQFGQLWNGDTTAHRGDHSSADLALCLLLAFWTGKDADRMDRLFRQSGLMRPKWERAGYRQRTIDKAIAECLEVYTERDKDNGGNGHDQAPPLNYSNYPEAQGQTRDKTAGAGPDNGPGQTGHRPDAGKSNIVHVSAILDRQSNGNQLIKGWMGTGEFALLFGESGSFKTLIALEMVIAIALGKNWRGHKVKQGAVLYIAGEGGGYGLTKRLQAYQIAHQVSLKDAPLFIREAPTLLPADTATLIEEIRTALDGTGLELVLVVLDTLNRTMQGNENSAEDFASYQQALDFLKHHFGCAHMVLSHVGHVEKGRPKGTYQLIGNPDCLLQTSVDTSLEPQQRISQLISTKQKDAELPKPKAFKLAVVDLGYTDNEGDAVTGVALIEVQDYQPAQEQQPLPRHAKLLLDVLTKLLVTDMHPDGVFINTTLRQAYYSALKADNPSITQDSARKAFKRSIYTLEKAKRIVNDENVANPRVCLREPDEGEQL